MKNDRKTRGCLSGKLRYRNPLLPRLKSSSGKFVLGAAFAVVVCAAAAFELPVKAADTAAVELGRRLFFDVRLSADGKTSCASCHRPEAAFQDGQRTAVGTMGRIGSRNTPSLFHVGSQNSLFWDGRRANLEAQALDPLLHPLEHGLESETRLIERLAGLPEYKAVMASGQALATVRRSLAAFQRTLIDGPNGFERFLFDGDQTAIAPAAQRGWMLFSGRAKCIECHQVGAAPPALFADHAFHDVVVPSKNGAKSSAELVKIFLALAVKEPEAGLAIAREPELAELGRFVVTREPKDIGRFKTPSLRNVGLTAPYMHDGSVPTLAEAVELEVYYRSRTSGRPLILLDAEKADLVAFLQTLTADSLLRR